MADISTINWGLIGGITGIIMIGILIVMFLAYRARKTPILKVFGASYFRFEILNPARKTQTVNRLSKDFKIHGKIILFNASGGWYRIMDDRIFLRDNIPTSIYKFGNPIPINVYETPDAEIAVYDEDMKSMVKVRMSAQELRDAIESKVVHDLNKFTFSRMEIIMVIAAAVGIIINIIVVYEIVQVNSEFGTLINQLNQILSQLPTKSNNPAP